MTYLTAAIAFLAAVIAFGQWHTARSKLVLDLFEQRLKIYDDLIAALRPVFANGVATDKDISTFAGPEARAAFFFGDEVTNYLATIRTALANLGYARAIMEADKRDDEHQRAIRLKRDEFRKIMTFPDEFGKLVRPYMRMDQKLLPRLKPLLYGGDSR